MTRKNVYIRKDNEAAWKEIENPSGVINDLISGMVHKKVEARAKWAEIDAEVNDGLLVEVCRILGKPLYIRVNHHDPELAKHELAEIRSIVKDVVVGED